MTTRYRPVEDGYRIIGSAELFNRALYGGHAQDGRTENTVTFAGDQPLVMGAVGDHADAYDQAKCGVFMAGLALTPGLKQAFIMSSAGQDGDHSSQWFHEADGTVSTFRNGWMEYEIRPSLPVFPTVEAFVEVLPLAPDAGFLVHLRIWVDQRLDLVMAFGGVTGFVGDLGARFVAARNFRPDDCRGNTVVLGTDRATVRNATTPETNVAIGTSFATDVSLGDANAIGRGPGTFLVPDNTSGETPMVRMVRALRPGRTLDGYVVVIRNGVDADLERWLQHPDPVTALKDDVRERRAVIGVRTPDRMLDLTVPPTVLAMDACWHRETFCHGAYEWHQPYLGWRNWYGPTVVGWHDRVAKAIRRHGADQAVDRGKPEEVVFEPDILPYHTLKNSHGFIPSSLGTSHIFYNMQEVYVDHTLHHLEWTGDMQLAAEVFPVLAGVLDWEERLLDPDGDGLYQNWLNTWVSDGHGYNGGGCAQSSAYNYRANRTMARLAELLGHDPRPFAARAEKIERACRELLWLGERGVMAEFVDTVGNRLIHPSPELATVYHCIESGLVDPFQAYQMLRFTETTLRNERTAARSGRLVWSSDWYPQNYSSCGLYTGENIHLAWAYFACGLADKGHDILTGIVDAHFMGYQPGMACHCMTASGYTSGSQDFADVLSMHLRLVVEGIFGVRFDLLHDRIVVAPNLPKAWKRADLEVKDFTARYRRRGRTESLTVQSRTSARVALRLPLRSDTIESVAVSGGPVDYRIEPGIGRSCLVVDTVLDGTVKLVVVSGEEIVPTLQYRGVVGVGDTVRITPGRGSVAEWFDPSAGLAAVRREGNSISGEVAGTPGWHTVFVRVRTGIWDGWMPADFRIETEEPKARLPQPGGRFIPLDLAGHFNMALTELHEQKYLNPRPAGYSYMTWVNGRYGWDWNRGGFQTTIVDDTGLRACGGTYTVPSGVPFATPPAGANVACVSVWDNFPTAMEVPLSGYGLELAVFFVGVTNPMQSRVENGCFSVHYADDTEERISLVNPDNFDDWLNAPLQTANESVCFSDTNQGIVQRVVLDPSRELRGLVARAVANEVVIGILGVSIRRADS